MFPSVAGPWGRMFAIAIKNLIHDKMRLAIALVGVTFSVILISAQVGIFLGFMNHARGQTLRAPS